MGFEVGDSRSGCARGRGGLGTTYAGKQEGIARVRIRDQGVGREGERVVGVGFGVGDSKADYARSK